MSVLQDELILRKFVKMKQRSHPGQCISTQEMSLSLQNQHLKDFRYAAQDQNTYLNEIASYIGRYVNQHTT